MTAPRPAHRLLTAAAALTVGLGVLLPALPASAHNSIVSTTPAEGETLTALPEAFVIETSDEILDLDGEGGGLAMQISGPAGAGARYYGDGCVEVTGRSMSTEAALGEPGTYELAWRLVSADSHPLSGVIAFEWDPADPAEIAEGSAEPATCGGAPAPGGDAGEQGAAADEPVEAEPGAGTDWIWLAGAGAAVLAAVVVTVLLARRRPAGPSGRDGEAPPAA